MDCLIPGRFGTRGPLTVLVLIGVIQAGASIVLIRMVEVTLGSPSEAAKAWPIAGAALAVATLAAARLAELWQAERLAQKIIHAQRIEMGRHLLNLAPRGRKSGRSEVLLRFMGEMSALRTWHMRAVPVMVVGTPVVIGGVLALAIRDPWLGLAALVPVVLALALQAVLTPRHLASAEITRRTRTRMAGTVGHHFEALPTIQSFGRTGRAVRDIEKCSARFADAMIDRAWYAGSLRAAAELGSSGMLIAILAVWFFHPGIEPPALAGALAFATVLGPRLRALGRVPEQFNVGRVAGRRIEAFLAEPPLDGRDDGAGIARRQGHLALRNLTIDSVLEAFSAEAQPGERVLVKGANGAGKSRLLGLVAGLEDPDGGSIVLDGRNTGLRRRSALRKLVAVAGDSLPLMAGRVSDNLTCGARVSETERDEILSLCRWKELEATLPDGARTRIGTGAPTLSAGQRARISLIRALLRKPLVLILDDIDGALDEAGRAVLDDVLGWFGGTVLIASHNPRWETAVSVVWTLPPPASRLNTTEAKSHA